MTTILAKRSATAFLVLIVLASALCAIGGRVASRGTLDRRAYASYPKVACVYGGSLSTDGASPFDLKVCRVGNDG
jgi:hypothetical protein